MPDIAQPGAFDAVVAEHGASLDVVMHTASPFHFKWTDAKTELVDPAVIGTTGILEALKRDAPGVKRVIITSSFASIMDEAHIEDPTHVFSEKSWNPSKLEDIERSPATAYRVSKTLAERAAWDFVAREKPGFDLVTVCPPVVLGPVAHHLATLDAINTSNERVVALLRGQWKDAIGPTGPVPLWVDVRDAATAHVLAMELPEAGGRRLFTVNSQRICNSKIAAIIRDTFPQFADRLPGPEVKGGEMPAEDKTFQFNNDETNKLLGIKWITAEKSVSDTVESLLALGI